MNLSISPINGILKPQKTNLLKNQNRISFSSACDSVSFGNIDKDEQVKALLDNTTFVFVDSEGEKFEGTIRGYFEDSVINYRDIGENFDMYHSTSREAAEDIVNNGLDWTKTNRMKCGPGTYFSPIKGGGSMQGGGAYNVKAVYTGDTKNYPVFEPSFYEAIENNKELNDAVSEITGKEGSREAINRYCHDLLQNDMEIDFLYAAAGSGGGGYVVFNNDCCDLTFDGEPNYIPW